MPALAPGRAAAFWSGRWRQVTGSGAAGRSGRATEGRRTVRRELLARDHSDPDRYFAVVFFDSYESAMANSSLPETKASAEQYMKVSDGPPVFHDLDILEDWA